MKHTDNQELKALRARIVVLEMIVSGLVAGMGLSEGLTEALADFPRKARAKGLPRSSMKLVRGIQRQASEAVKAGATTGP